MTSNDWSTIGQRRLRQLHNFPTGEQSVLGVNRYSGDALKRLSPSLFSRWLMNIRDHIDPLPALKPLARLLAKRMITASEFDAAVAYISMNTDRARFC